MKTSEYNKISVAFEWWCAHGAFVNPAHCDDLRSFRRDLMEALNRGAFRHHQLQKVKSFIDHIDRQITLLETIGSDDFGFVCKRCGDRVSKRQKLSVSPPLSPLHLTPTGTPTSGGSRLAAPLTNVLKLPQPSFLHSCAWGCSFEFPTDALLQPDNPEKQRPQLLTPPGSAPSSPDLVPAVRRLSMSSTSSAASPVSSASATPSSCGSPASSAPSSPQHASRGSPLRIVPTPIRLDLIAAASSSASKPKRYHRQTKTQEYRIKRLSERLQRRVGCATDRPTPILEIPIAGGHHSQKDAALCPSDIVDRSVAAPSLSGVATKALPFSAGVIVSHPPPAPLAPGTTDDASHPNGVGGANGAGSRSRRGSKSELFQSPKVRKVRARSRADSMDLPSQPHAPQNQTALRSSSPRRFTAPVASNPVTFSVNNVGGCQTSSTSAAAPSRTTMCDLDELVQHHQQQQHLLQLQHQQDLQRHLLLQQQQIFLQHQLFVQQHHRPEQVSIGTPAIVHAEAAPLLSPASQPFFIQLDGPSSGPASQLLHAVPFSVGSLFATSSPAVPASEHRQPLMHMLASVYAAESVPAITLDPYIGLNDPEDAPLPTSEWHHKLYDFDPQDHQFAPMRHPHALADITNLASGNEEPSSEFAALHIENDFEVTPHPREHQHVSGQDRVCCGDCNAQVAVAAHGQHNHRRRKSSESPLGDGYEANRGRAYSALPGTGEPFQKQPRLAEATDIYAKSRHPTYVSNRRGEDSCSIC